MTPSDERDMARQNAPNPTTKDTKDVGGKTEIKKTEGGTVPSSTLDEVLARTKPDSISSVTHEQAEAVKKEIVVKEVEVSGQKAIIRGLDQNSVDKAEKNWRNDPNLAPVQGTGNLQGDKSLRRSESLEEQQDEMNITAGQNPTPLREGNELTKAMEGTKMETLVLALKKLGGLADGLQAVIDDKHISKENKELVISVQKEIRLAAV